MQPRKPVPAINFLAALKYTSIFITLRKRWPNGGKLFDKLNETMVCICIADIYIVSSNEFISFIANQPNLYRPYLKFLIIGCI